MPQDAFWKKPLLFLTDTESSWLLTPIMGPGCSCQHHPMTDREMGSTIVVAPTSGMGSVWALLLYRAPMVCPLRLLPPSPMEAPIWGCSIPSCLGARFSHHISTLLSVQVSHSLFKGLRRV